MKFFCLRNVLTLLGFFTLFFCESVLAQVSPTGVLPVRIAIVPGGGSGMEQEVADRISACLSSNNNIKVSTVNPDWFVTCNILDRTDVGAGSVRVNGTVVIKTNDGQVLDTVSMQTNKQDFSLTPGMPVNKALSERAAREVIQGIVDRSIQPLLDAVDLEIQVREKLGKAQSLGDLDKYIEAIQILSTISQDSPHYNETKKLSKLFEMEQRALDSINKAEELAKQKKYTQAIEVLKTVERQSKRFNKSKELITKYRSLMLRKASPRITKSTNNLKTGTNAVDAQLKALEEQKKALDLQKKAVESQEAAIKGNIKSNSK